MAMRRPSFRVCKNVKVSDILPSKCEVLPLYCHPSSLSHRGFMLVSRNFPYLPTRFTEITDKEVILPALRPYGKKSASL
jgi:hypothetical protein